MARCRVCFSRLAHNPGCERHTLGPAPVEAVPGPRIAGIRLGAWLGGGGVAHVWATSRGDAVVKVAHAGSASVIACFDREARALAAPTRGAPALLARGRTDDGRPYLVMTRVIGEPLSAALARATYGVADAVRVTRALCATLARLHERGIVHGDVKPENILVSASGAGIIDFGCARQAGEVSAADGTLAYMAPEHLERGLVRPSTDVYATATVLFELVAGRTPFAGDRGTLVFEVSNARAPRLSRFAAVSAGIDDLVARCLAKDPAVRPRDAAVLAAALAEVENGPIRRTPRRNLPADETVARVPCALLAISSDDARAGARVCAHGGVLAARSNLHHVYLFAPTTRGVPARFALAAAEACGATRASVHVAARDAVAAVDVWASDQPGITLSDAARQALAPYVDRPTFVGRTAVLEEVGSARAGLFAITAEPGLGKTALLDALAARCTGARVVRLAAAPRRAGDRSALVDALLRECPASEQLDDLARKAVAWARGSTDTQSLFAAAGALRAATARAIADGLARAARAEHTVLILDDAHLADDAVIDGIAAASRADVPLVAVLAGRPALLASHPSLAGHAICLGHLAYEEAATLVRHLLEPVSAISKDVIDTLIARTHGHPFELVELVAALRREHLVVRGARGRWEVDVDVLRRVPESHMTSWLMERTLADLPAPLLAHARLLASVAPDEIAGVLEELDRRGHGEQFPLDAERGVQLLESAGIIADGRFRNARLADVLRTTTDPTTLRTIHEAALGLAYQHLHPDDALVRRAHHAYASGDPELFGPLQLQVGELALARHRYLDAELACGRAIEAGDAADRLRVHWVRAIARYRLGRPGAAADDFAVARALARARGDRDSEAELLLHEAMSLDWAAEFPASAACVAAAAELVGRYASPRLRAFLAMSEGRTRIRAGRESEALAPLELAISLASALGACGYEILVVSLVQAAPILATCDRLDEACAAFERVLGLAIAAGDHMHECAARANRLLRPYISTAAQLESDYERVLAIARELGHFIIEFTAEVNFAVALHWLGDHQRALYHARRAVEREQHLGDVVRPEATLVEARILAALGNSDAVRSALARIDASELLARLAGRPESLLTDSERVLLDAVRTSIDARAHPSLSARAALLPRHERDEVEALLARGRREARA